ncbi:type II toxin-antitoxin system VapC family toxin [Candidatus Woesearchaeota archaeon]|nr:type II toxin-antitoxin system VapC family toxin [Candidatus Woesearchaeota archaeon]
MVRKICLDSDVLISIMNNDLRVKTIFQSLDSHFYTTSINSFEIWYGRKDSENISELLQSLIKLELDDHSARIAADILRELRRKGELIDVKDLFIASICIKNNLELFTFNKKHFERLQKYGLQLPNFE